MQIFDFLGIIAEWLLLQAFGIIGGLIEWIANAGFFEGMAIVIAIILVNILQAVDDLKRG